MKIFFDTIIFSLQKSGGISVVYYELLKRLLNDEDIQLKLLEYKNKNIFRKELNIPPELFLKKSWSKIPIIIQRFLNPYFSDEKGIFHSSYYRITKNPNIVNITTVHDFTYEYFRKGLPKIIHRYQKNVALKNSQRIICVSQNTKKDLMKFHPEISESRIKVIYNGVDQVYKIIPKENTTDISHLIPFSQGDYILYVGDRKSEYKNFRIAVEACSLINMPLLIVGGGVLSSSEKIYLEAKLGKNNYHSLVGIGNETLNLLYNQAFCLLYPSSYEGFGIPIIEAQKAGCPVICNNYASIPEIAGNGTILLDKIDSVSIAESINLLHSNSAFKDNLIQNGIVNSNRFSWDKCYQQTKELYTEVYNNYFIK